MARFRPSALFRRKLSTKSSSDSRTSSTTSTLASTPSIAAQQHNIDSDLPLYAPTPRKSASISRLRDKFQDRGAEVPEAVQEQRESVFDCEELSPHQAALEPPRRSTSETLAPDRSFVLDEKTTPSVHELKLDSEDVHNPPILTVEEPTPDALGTERTAPTADSVIVLPPTVNRSPLVPQQATGTEQPGSAVSSRSVSPATVPVNKIDRRQSLVNSANAKIVKTLIEAPAKRDGGPPTASTALPTSAAVDYFTPGLPNMTSMLTRKIWVRRPGQSATLVQIREDDLVDDVRDMILKKYANSLGRTFDAPDMTLRIAQRAEHGQHRSERVLGPEEEMCRTIDSYYAGGQTVEDALIIDVPQKRTPRPSPKVYGQHAYHSMDDYRPLENGNDYFPPMNTLVPATIPQTAGSHDSRTSQHHNSVVGPLEQQHQRSISVLNTGQIPPLPSPGGTRRHREHRPRYQRQQTSSPIIMAAPPNVGAVAVAPSNTHQPLVHRSSNRPRMDSSASDAHHANGVPAPPPLPTPPAPEAPPTNRNVSSPPTPSGPTPVRGERPSRPRKHKRLIPGPFGSRSQHQRDDSANAQTAAANLAASTVLEGSVPPINVLIVEDNIINLRILEGLMKRLKVRWQTAMNGQIAVDKYKAGGFHLVLMDIQMPIMNGLQATKEIRRLERVNGIGVFSSSAPTSPIDRKGKGRVEDGNGEAAEDARDPDEAFKAQVNGHSRSPEDKLQLGDGLFKSPVIIVALTASSLQSDRHEALAAGCNDFLTKPVNFVWLERKVKEWGCMQALIDYDGWKKWKDHAAKEAAGMSDEQRRAEAEKEEKQKIKMEKMAKLQEKQKLKKEEDERKKKRQSFSASLDGVIVSSASGSAADNSNGSGSNGVAQTNGTMTEWEAER